MAVALLIIVNSLQNYAYVLLVLSAVMIQGFCVKENIDYIYIKIARVAPEICSRTQRQPDAQI